MADQLVETPAYSAEDLVRDAKAYFYNGEFFRSYDIAIEGLSHFPDEWRLAHRAVLSLANAGATDLALVKFKELGLENGRNLEIRALLGRLYKDRAFGSAGVERHEYLAMAYKVYEAVYRQERSVRNPEAYYPGINAAGLALLNAGHELAKRLAKEILELVTERTDVWIERDAPDRYWVIATAIEANVILGDLDAARTLIPLAQEASGFNYADLATTGRQLERLLVAQGKSLDVLGNFAPPTIIHYVGHIIAAPGNSGRFPASEERRVSDEIGRVLDGKRLGAAYGSLAAGADILFAEALLKRQIALNLVLPFRIEDFLENSVRRAGPGWEERFNACLAAAKTVRYATEDAYLGDDHLFTYCSRLAMGLAVLLARHMRAPVEQLAVWDGQAVSGVAGTVADLRTWQKAGHPQTIIRCGSSPQTDDLEGYRRPDVPRHGRDTRAMLFGDIHGFSKLTDAQLPLFVDIIMGTLARVFKAYEGDIAFRNTWGDGIFVAFADAGRAAACALAMQEAVSAIDLVAAGLPETLKLRLGGHLGPVYEIEDPIMHRPNFYGAHVSRSARIEPITPEGCVYVTETFAAVLALHNAKEFSCDYVGYTEMAKHYGQLRMFLLRRSRDGAGPAVLANIEQAPIGASN